MLSSLAVLPLVVSLHGAEPPADTVDRFEADPGRFRFRRASLGFGLRGFTNFSPCRFGGGLPDGCGLSPMLAATAHVGWRRLTFVGELSTSPVPRVDYD